MSFLTDSTTQAGPATLFASTVEKGMLVYDGNANALKFCDGTNWLTLADTGGAGANAAGPAGYVQISDGSGGLTYSGSTAGQEFFWDNTNKRLGIGTATPPSRLTVHGGGLALSAAEGDVTLSFRPEDQSAAYSNTADERRLDFMQTGMNGGVFGYKLAWRNADGSARLDALSFHKDGGIGIGVTSPNPSALLTLNSTTRGFLPPRMTEADRDAIASPATGLVVYNTDSDALNYYDGDSWEAVGTGAAGSPSVYFHVKGEANKGGGTLKSFPTVVSNEGGAYNNTTGVFTAPKTGVYFFNASVLPTGASTINLYLRKNGASLQSSYAHTGEFEQLQVSSIAHMSAGDTVDVVVSGAGLHTNSWDSFYGSIIEGGGGGGGSTTLAGLTDVDLTGLADGNTLVWNTSTSSWEPGTAAGGGSGSGGGSFMSKTLSATWTVVSGAVVPFNTVLSSHGSNITQSGNQITLKAGSSYMLIADLRAGSMANEAFDYNFYDVTASAFVGSNGSEADGANLESNAYALVRPSVDTTYELRVLGVAGSVTALPGYSTITAVELGGGGGSATAAGSVAGAVQFNDGSDAFAADDVNLVWDNTNKRLGIGTATPVRALDVRAGNGFLARLIGTADSNNTYLELHNDGVTPLSTGIVVGEGSAGLGYLRYAFQDSEWQVYAGGGTSADRKMVIEATGNVGVGTTTPRSRLHVDGGIQLGDDSDTCPGASNVKLGTLRFNSGALQICTIGGWRGVGGGVPTGTIAAFAAASCPDGWAEYTPARGRFLRGIDNGAGIDGAGTRAPGHQQEATEVLYRWGRSVGWHYAVGDFPDQTAGFDSTRQISSLSANYINSDGSNNDTYVRLGKIRPANVAVLFCQYTGTGGGGTDTLAGLSCSTNEIPKWNGSAWACAADEEGGASAEAAGDDGQIQFNDGSDAFAADTNLHWDNTNKRLGIGTANPGALLHVNQATITVGSGVGDSSELLQLSGSAGNNAYLKTKLYRSTAGTGWTGVAIRIQSGVDSTDMGYIDFNPGVASQGLAFGNAGSEYMRISSAGNVGIGTTSPDHRLDVNGNIRGSLVVKPGGTYTDGSIFSDGNWGMLFRSAQSSPAIAAFSFADTANNKLLSILNNGNVGIGTTAPTQRLQVGGAIVASGAADTLTADGLYLQNKGSSIFDIGAWRTGASAGVLTFSTDSGSDAAPVERMRIDQNGNVGIGTTNPVHKLDIANSAGSTNGIRIVNSGSGSSDAAWLSNTTPGGRVLALHKTGGTGDIMQAFYNDGSGYSFRLTLGNTGAMWIAGTLTQNSDMTLKKDIADIPDALERISRLRGVSYRWKDPQRGAEQQLGLLAQEVEKIFPEVVSTQADGTKGVAYTSLIGPLIESIKELKADNDNLRAELKAANDNYQDLRREIDALKVAR
ncbi:tail fiber domain-containing protein [Hyphomicrobium sp.]|uniref:tail fiber domain-containing protein n=1 Tax=Hyphomicrobium sp. TaxID=82 RepID=UPI002FE26975